MRKFRIFTVIAVITAFFTVGHSQGMIEKGVIGGINYVSIGGPDSDFDDGETKRLMRFTVGGYATFKLSNMFNVRPEMHYSMKGYGFELSDSETERSGEMRINYLDIPVLVMINPTPKLKVFAGPSIGIYLNGEVYSKISYNGESISRTEDIEDDLVASPDFGAVIGSSYSVTDKLSLDVRYTMGLKTIADEGGEDIKHNGLQLLLSRNF